MDEHGTVLDVVVDVATAPPPARFDTRLDASAGLMVSVVGVKVIVVAPVPLLVTVELPLPEADESVPFKMGLEELSPP